MKEFAYQELVEATEGFSPARVIGKGSHGWVYRATVRVEGHGDDHYHDREVAVKKSSVRDNTKLDNETNVLSSLHRNPHVINVLGTSQSTAVGHSKNVTTTTKLLVMDLMPNGSLHDLLHSTTTPPPPWPKRVDLAVQIAKAIRSLHAGETPVVHRDIKSANILFDSDWNVKLADFGLALKLHNDTPLDPLSRPAGTMGYLDPSYTTPNKLSTKNDVFSFGVVLLEIFSSAKVIDVSRTPSDIVEWAVPEIERGRWSEVCEARVPMPSYMEDTVMHMLRIAASCVSSDENSRPTMEQVVDQMEGCNDLVKPRVRFPMWSSIVIMAERRRWRWAIRWSSGIGEEKKQLVTLKEVLGDFVTMK